jgi:hypothetical protein
MLVELTVELIGRMSAEEAMSVLAAFDEVLRFADVVPACPDCAKRAFVPVEGGVGCAACGWEGRSAC